MRGCVRTVWVQGKSLEIEGRRTGGQERVCADGVGAREGLEMGEEKARWT